MPGVVDVVLHIRIAHLQRPTDQQGLVSERADLKITVKTRSKLPKVQTTVLSSGAWTDGALIYLIAAMASIIAVTTLMRLDART